MVGFMLWDRWGKIKFLDKKRETYTLSFWWGDYWEILKWCEINHVLVWNLRSWLENRGEKTILEVLLVFRSGDRREMGIKKSIHLLTNAFKYLQCARHEGCRSEYELSLHSHCLWASGKLDKQTDFYHIVFQIFSSLGVQKWKSLSSVWLFAAPWTIQSMEFSRPECWSG